MGPLYALDIETDTAADPVEAGVPAGLDPRAGGIISVAVASPGGLAVFDDRDEARLLRGLAAWLADPSTAAGVVVTWNGAAFDLPYLADRAARHGVDLGIVLVPAADRPPKYRPLPGHTGGYRARAANLAVVERVAYNTSDSAVTLALAELLGDRLADHLDGVGAAGTSEAAARRAQPARRRQP